MLLIFQITLTVVLCSVQYFFHRTISLQIRDARKPASMKRTLDAFFLLFNLPLLALLFYRPPVRLLPGWLIVDGVYPFYIWHFSFLLLFVLFIAGNFLNLVYRSTLRILGTFNVFQKWIGARSKERFDGRRRAFIRRGAAIAAGAAFTGSAYGAFRHDQYELTEISISIDNLPEAFIGFSIAFISDIHSSVFMLKEKMDHYVAAVNALKTDLVAVTGDFVNSSVDEVYPFAEAFSNLRAPHGVYGVLGNHDFYTRKVEVVSREVDDCGVKLLRNDRITLRKGNDSLQFAGVDDTGGNARAARLMDIAMAGSNSRIPTILMCHRPYFFDQASARNIDLTLSGHTHGGQIVFGRIGQDVLAPARIASPYVAGLYSMKASKMYVSRGIGTVGVPIRINCPPEITKITLTKA